MKWNFNFELLKMLMVLANKNATEIKVFNGGISHFTPFSYSSTSHEAHSEDNTSREKSL